jgi:RNA polymerase sigma-70 factor (ECF subfamily)
MTEITEDVLTQAAQGDLKAFELIYKHSSSFVYNVAFRVVGNKEDAQEVAQEVFLTVHHKLKEFRFESSFKTWTYRITTNLAINMAKKNSKIRNKTATFDEEINPIAVEANVKVNIEKEHNEQLVKNLLNEINPDQRACVVLRNIEGLSYEEIAQTLKININTVRTRLKRAREKMLLVRKQVLHGQV